MESWQSRFGISAGNGFGIEHRKGLDKCERIVENMVDYLNLQQIGGHQMGKYKIKVKVEIVETDDLEVGSLTKGKDGSFEININEVDAISIDKCERALLRANYPAIREAISSHLSEISKKKSLRSGRRKS